MSVIRRRHAVHCVYANGFTSRKGVKSTMPITTPRELCLSMLSELRHGAERSQKIYQELGEAAQNPEIKEALDARELVSSQIITRLDECFKLIGEKPSKVNERLQRSVYRKLPPRTQRDPGSGCT